MYLVVGKLEQMSPNSGWFVAFDKQSLVRICQHGVASQNLDVIVNYDIKSVVRACTNEYYGQQDILHIEIGRIKLISIKHDVTF